MPFCPIPTGGGPNHVVYICNRFIQWYDKLGVLQDSDTVAESNLPDPDAGWWFLGIESAVIIDGELSFADYTGHPVCSGVYFYCLEAGSFGESRKMVLIK